MVVGQDKLRVEAKISLPTKLNSPCSSCHPRSYRILSLANHFVSQCRRPHRETPVGGVRRRQSRQVCAIIATVALSVHLSLQRQHMIRTSGRSMPASEAKELSCNPGNEPSEFELGHFGTDGTCPITLPKPPLPPLPTLQKLAPLARRSWLQSPVGPCSARCMASMLDLGDNASRLPCGSLCFLSCELKLPNVLKVPEPIGESNEPDAPTKDHLC